MTSVRSNDWRAAAREALPVWAASRVVVAFVSIVGAWTLAGDSNAGAVPSFTTLWNRWDVGLYIKVAQHGYFAPSDRYGDCCTAAFFPGEPLALRAVHPLIPDWVAAGLLISLVASAFATVALYRLGTVDGGRLEAQRAVLYLVLAPYAVFLFAGYSEALFLAFAVPSWLAAREGRWRAAGLLGAAAAFVRITGFFLGLGLVVEYAVARRGRPGRDSVWLLAPFAAVAAYWAWLYHRTGDLLAWHHAQAEGWDRKFTLPWRAFKTTFDSAFNDAALATHAWSFRAEIIAVLLGVVLTVVLLKQRRYGEATFVGSCLFVLATSAFYLSVVRAALTWFPLYLLMARMSLRREWLHYVFVWLCAPLMLTMTLAFTAGHWVA